MEAFYPDFGPIELSAAERYTTPTELGFEDMIFLDQIRDHLLLVTLKPAGYHGDEHMQNHDLSSG